MCDRAAHSTGECETSVKIHACRCWGLESVKGVRDGGDREGGVYWSWFVRHVVRGGGADDGDGEGAKSLKLEISGITR
jgi:hypothetical protein